MDFKVLFLITLWILLADQTFSARFLVRYQESSHVSAFSTNPSAYIRCHCDDGVKTENLTTIPFRRSNQHSMITNLHGNNVETLREIKKNSSDSKNCDRCKIEAEYCSNAPEYNGYMCSKKTFEMKEKKEILDSVSSQNVKRSRRQAACSYPKGLQNSFLYVMKYPSSIWIKQKCIFGHTLEEGISREMRCKYAEDKWKPTGFEDCRPFIDCTLNLVSPGRLECATATVDETPYCNVTCDPYEDKPDVPKDVYECQIDGGWKPELPYCAIAGSGLNLVPAPSVKIHPEEEDFPTPKPSKKEKSTKIPPAMSTVL